MDVSVRTSAWRFRSRAHVDCFLMHVVFRPEVTARQRRAHLRRLTEQTRRVGVLLVHRDGLCLLHGAEHVCTRSQRTRLLAWLAKQCELRTVLACDHQRLRDLVRFGDCPRELFEVMPACCDPQALQSWVQRLATTAVTQWTRYIEGRIP